MTIAYTRVAVLAALLLATACSGAGTPLPPTLDLKQQDASEPCASYSGKVSYSFYLDLEGAKWFEYEGVPRGWTILATQTNQNETGTIASADSPNDYRSPTYDAPIGTFGKTVDLRFTIEVLEPEATVRRAEITLIGKERYPGSEVRVFDSQTIVVKVPSCDEKPDEPGPDPIPEPATGDFLLFVRSPEAFSNDTGLYAGELPDPNPAQSGKLRDWPDLIEEARVSPDARWLAFTSVREESGEMSSEIYLLDRTDKDAAPVRLTDGLAARVHFYEIDWSRDNQRIAARRLSLSSGNSTIAVITIPTLPFDEGAGEIGVDLTVGTDDSHPAWGPADGEIAFVRHLPVPGTTGYRRLHRIEVASGVVRPDDRFVDHVDGVAWSPDGNKIAFASNNAIWILRGGEREEAYNITAGDLKDLPFANPEFSPDSKTVVMSAYVGGKHATLLFAVAADTDGGSGTLEERPDPPMLLPVSDSGGLGGQFFYPSMFRESSE